MTTQEILQKANQAKYRVMAASTEEKKDALMKMADALEKAAPEILAANEADLAPRS